MSSVAKPKFETRRVGQTKLEITTLGLGGATLGGNMVAVSEEQAHATITRARAAGITYFDTAPYYGMGRSERLFGDALRAGGREGVVLSTKVGRLMKPFSGKRPADFGWVDALPFDQVYDYSYDGIMRSFEDSLQRLGLNRIDILYVHDIGPMTHGEEANKPLWQQLASSGYKALRELRDGGAISAIGLGVNEWEVLMEAFKLGDWDVFLLAGRYTLLEQTSLDPFLTTCLERNTSIVVGGPFNGGALMGTGMWNYAKAPQTVIDRVHQLEALCKEFGVALGAAALQFPLAHKAVCNVLPGPKAPEELDGILQWWQADIPGAFWDALADRKLVAPGTPLPNGKVAG